MALSEQQIKNWARALSETENSKCVNTVSAIRKVLEDHFGSKIKVFLQGSYANSTNVRQDSDVDIVACYQDAYFPNYSFLDQVERVVYESNATAHDYKFSEFKNDVMILLRSNFGTSVERKEKCIHIKGNIYRVNVDVVPCFLHSRFMPSGVTIEGIELRTDTAKIPVKNFPDQHKANGQEKNQLTDQKYKAVVRILKNCRNFLIDNNHIDEKFMPSFFLECIVWNVPNSCFMNDSYKEMTNNVISKIYDDMSVQETANNYAEISDLIWLFKGQTKRTPAIANQFLKQVYGVIN